ncbi:transposable element Tcb2 transposase [Trichonephila clavipes]|nr:transposable element Tcb2 transposase [Trichonephila clavipes]
MEYRLSEYSPRERKVDDQEGQCNMWYNDFDIPVPLTRSSDGNNIPVVIEYFTKWPGAYPIPDQETSTVAEVLVQHWISTQIRSSSTIPLRFREKLRFCSLQETVSAVHETTGCSPSQMLFVCLQISCSAGHQMPEENVEKLQAQMEEMHHLPRDRIGMARYVARATGHDFHEGGKVWLWNPKRRKGLSSKLQTNWKDLIDELKIFGMSSRHHIDDFMRGRIIGKIEEERKITDVGREFDIAHSVVSRLWKSFKTTGMCSRRHGDVVLEVRRLQKTDISSYQQKGTGAPQLSRGGGLYARRPVVCVPLTRQHRTARLQWCREHHNWTEQDWACVLFSDESRFSLSSDCRRQLIWRESGTAYRPENIQEKDRYPTCSIRVWASIMINGRTRLHVVANGTMTGQRYIDEVLLPHVCLFRGAVGDIFVFMDDNATCHRTLAVQDCLDSEGIQRLVWPARSPDLNPIENVWDALGRQVAGRNYPPTNKNTLIRALTEEWDKLPQQLLDNVVQSMVRRVECCITLHGGHIPY